MRPGAEKSWFGSCVGVAAVVALLTELFTAIFVNCSRKIWRDLEFESLRDTELLIHMCDISLKDWGEMRIEKEGARIDG